MTRTPIPNCPQSETPIRDRAWTEGQKADMHREDFESWWNASKYMQVVFSSDAIKQAAWDGYQAALRYRDEKENGDV